MRFVISFFVSLFLTVVAHAQQGSVIGPNPPCSAFGTTTGTCLQAGVQLIVNTNTSAVPTPPAGTTLQVAGAQNALNRIVMNATGSTPFNIINFISSNGTFALPTATQSGNIIGGFGSYGYGATAYGTGGGASILILASQNWTDAAQGTNIVFSTTPNGSATIATSLTLNASGGIWVGTTNVDEGSNNLGVQGQMFMPSITVQSTAANGNICWTTGTGKFTVDTTLACLTSSARFKNIVTEVTPEQALEIVDRLRTVSFTKKQAYGGDLDPAEQFGLTAEQAASVDERLVSRDTEGAPLGVRYAQFTAVLAGAVRQLKADNDNLRASNNGSGMRRVSRR